MNFNRTVCVAGGLRWHIGSVLLSPKRPNWGSTQHSRCGIIVGASLYGCGACSVRDVEAHCRVSESLGRLPLGDIRSASEHAVGFVRLNLLLEPENCIFVYLILFYNYIKYQAWPRRQIYGTRSVQRHLLSPETPPTRFLPFLVWSFEVSGFTLLC